MIPNRDRFTVRDDCGLPRAARAVFGALGICAITLLSPVGVWLQWSVGTLRTLFVSRGRTGLRFQPFKRLQRKTKTKKPPMNRWFQGRSANSVGFRRKVSSTLRAFCQLWIGRLWGRACTSRSAIILNGLLGRSSWLSKKCPWLRPWALSCRVGFGGWNTTKRSGEAAGCLTGTCCCFVGIETVNASLKRCGDGGAVRSENTSTSLRKVFMFQRVIIGQLGTSQCTLQKTSKRLGSALDGGGVTSTERSSLLGRTSAKPGQLDIDSLFGGRGSTVERPAAKLGTRGASRGFSVVRESGSCTHGSKLSRWAKLFGDRWSRFVPLPFPSN